MAYKTEGFLQVMGIRVKVKVSEQEYCSSEKEIIFKSGRYVFRYW